MKVRILIYCLSKGNWKCLGIKDETLESGKESHYVHPDFLEQVMADIRSHGRAEAFTEDDSSLIRYVYLLLEDERQSWPLADRALSQKINGFSID